MTRLTLATVIVGLLLVAVLVLIRWSGDRWWFGTVLMYLPRFIWIIPVATLAAAAGLARRFTLWLIHLALALLVVWPLMGLHLPIGRWMGNDPVPRGRHSLRVLSLNVGPDGLDERSLIELINREQIEILCFQEIENRSLPRLEAYFAGSGWWVNSRRTISSRFPLVHDLPRIEHPWKEGSFWGPRVDVARIRLTDGTLLDVVSAHLPTIRFGLDRLRSADPAGLQSHIRWRQQQVQRMLETVRPNRGVTRLVGADLNAPSDSALLDPLRPWFEFCFERAGTGYGYTRPARWPFVGIDHILCTRDATPLRSKVGPDVGSDHLPMLAELLLP